MDIREYVEQTRQELVSEVLRRLEVALGPFRASLDAFLDNLFSGTLPLDWRERWHLFVAEQLTHGFRVEPQSVDELEAWIEAWAKECGRWPKPMPLAQRMVAHQLAPDKPPAARATQKVERPVNPPSSPRKPPPPSPANARGVDPDVYTETGREIIRILGSDWKSVTTEAISQLRRRGWAVDQATGAAIGHGSNSLGVEAFVRLPRIDGGTDTARFRFVFPWFSPHHWELVELIRGAKPEVEAAKLATQQRIRHADVMRVRNATARAQGAMFAIIGGVAGITEGATLLGTLEAARGVEEGALAAMDLSQGGEHRAWTTRAVQTVLEAAGVEESTARFLADNGELLVALGRASLDAAGAAHAVIETSSGYQIRLEFDPATLSSEGLGGAKIKVTRFAPDGTEIHRVGGRFPINNKWAGQTMPASILPKGLQAKYPKGVRFTSEGYPDFSPYEKNHVDVDDLTGVRGTDGLKANAKAGYDSTPVGYTWHHHENGIMMQLVPTDLHEAVRHTGGAATIRHGGS